MFTGIVKGIGIVQKIERRPGLNTLQIMLPDDARAGVELGASIAVDGVCLTVCSIEPESVSFDVMHQTLQVTTLGSLREGCGVNIERAARAQDEVGGHQLSGHIDCLGTVTAIETPENNHVLSIAVDPQWKRYIFSKGYIALNGASLTVASFDKDAGMLKVWLIPETLRLTTFAEKKVGDFVNIEIDRNTQIIVDSVFSFLEQHLPRLRAEVSEGSDGNKIVDTLKALSEK